MAFKLNRVEDQIDAVILPYYQYLILNCVYVSHNLHELRRKEENVRYTLKEDDVVNLVDFYLFATHSALNFVKFASYTAARAVWNSAVK